MLAASHSSSASTDSATLRARPFTRAANTRAPAKSTWRGEGGKNTNPTISAPACRETSSASRVRRPQILMVRLMLERNPSDASALAWHNSARHPNLPPPGGGCVPPNLPPREVGGGRVAPWEPLFGSVAHPL